MTSTASLTPTSVTTSFGTLGPLERQLRVVLGLSCGGQKEHSVALVFANANLPDPGRDLTCRHIVLDGECPLLVLAAVHHDTCFYFVVDLTDTNCRQEFSRGYRLGRLEVAVVDQMGNVDTYFLEVPDEEHAQVRQALNTHTHAMQVPHLLQLRWGELCSRAAETFLQLEPTAAKCSRHCSLVLLGEPAAHLAGIRMALKMSRAARI